VCGEERDERNCNCYYNLDCDWFEVEGATTLDAASAAAGAEEDRDGPTLVEGIVIGGSSFGGFTTQSYQKYITKHTNNNHTNANNTIVET
jgi:hypothetical protein